MEQRKNKNLMHKHKILIVDDQAEQLKVTVPFRTLFCREWKNSHRASARA